MEPKRLFDIMAIQARERPLPDALAAKTSGSWVKYPSAKVVEIADQISLGLMQLGLKKGERVALISMNRPEWALCDLGILQTGAASVPIYPTATATDYEFILGHAGARVALVSNQAILAKVEQVRSKLPNLKEVYSFDRLPGVKHLDDLIALGRNGPPEALAKAKAAVNGPDLASLIYTSGTTGTPKGVMLTHDNILANLAGVAKVMPARGLTRALSFLPLSHVFERTVSYFYQHSGIGIYYAESIDTLAKNLKEVSPQVFVTVPRLLEKVFETFTTKGRQLAGVKRKLFEWALALGQGFDPDRAPGLSTVISLAVARRLVFSKLLDGLGGELKLVIVGGSALPPRLARVFWAANLPVLEGYGLTETAPVIAVNTPSAHRLGCVGKPLPNVSVRIQQEEGYRPGEGEILAKGASIMQGYLNNPDATREALDPDGWFHTGDIGVIDEAGFLKLTDRKKEMFKTSGGKYVAPLALENKFKESPYIAQVVVVGENRKFPSALVVPEPQALADWCKQSGVPYANLTEAIRQDQVRQLFSGEIERLNQGFGQWERVKQFRLVADEWSVATGEMTPKLSLKRKVIMTKYRDLIDGMYRDGKEA
jgi:long-chain acyl-CoA synthetase